MTKTARSTGSTESDHLREKSMRTTAREVMGPSRRHAGTPCSRLEADCADADSGHRVGTGAEGGLLHLAPPARLFMTASWKPPGEALCPGFHTALTLSYTPIHHVGVQRGPVFLGHRWFESPSVRGHLGPLVTPPSQTFGLGTPFVRGMALHASWAWLGRPLAVTAVSLPAGQATSPHHLMSMGSFPRPWPSLPFSGSSPSKKRVNTCRNNWCELEAVRSCKIRNAFLKNKSVLKLHRWAFTCHPPHEKGELCEKFAPNKVAIVLFPCGRL